MIILETVCSENMLNILLKCTVLNNSFGQFGVFKICIKMKNYIYFL